MDGLQFDFSDLERGVNDFATRGYLAIRLYADTAAIKLQNYAKNNAKWTDRTGAARGRLNGYVTPLGDIIRVNLAHGVDYGIWLELAHSKRFAIVQPTIELKSQEVFNGLNSILDKQF